MAPWVVYACLGAGLASALVAGVFQSFSDFVMRGLVLAEPASGIESMQHINRTVLRSAFLVTFLALVPGTVVFAGYAWLRLEGPGRPLILAAAAIYVVTVFGVTVVGNITMNDRLESMSHRSSEAHAYWSIYGLVWTRYNHVRTLGSLAAAACFLLAAARTAGAP